MIVLKGALWLCVLCCVVLLRDESVGRSCIEDCAKVWLNMFMLVPDCCVAAPGVDDLACDAGLWALECRNYEFDNLSAALICLIAVLCLPAIRLRISGVLSIALLSSKSNDSATPIVDCP